MSGNEPGSRPADRMNRRHFFGCLAASGVATMVAGRIAEAAPRSDDGSHLYLQGYGCACEGVS